ncbi:MAG: sugar transferase [Flavicella sp.]
MNKKKKINYINVSERRVLLRIFDILSVLIGIFTIARILEVQYLPIDADKSIQWISIYLVYFMVFGSIFEMYDLKTSSARYSIFQSIFITAFTSVLFYLFTPIITPSFPNDRIDVLFLFLAVLVPVTIWRVIYSTFIFSPRLVKNIMVIGNEKRVKHILQTIKNKNVQVNIICYVSDTEIQGLKDYKYMPIKGANLRQIAEETVIDEIIISKNSIDLTQTPDISKQLIFLFEHGINIKSIANYYEEITLRVSEENLTGNFYKHVSFSKNHENTFYLMFVRLADIVISLIGLSSFVVFLPIVLLGNLIGNRGPLFYKQVRVGRNGEHFSIYKFRSMVVNAESEGKAVWAKKNDMRITPFGKFMRKTRIDETPQFINILLGEMSLIGPRPERPEFVGNLKNEIPFYAIRHVIPPGLTGWAQVMYPYANTIEEQGVKLRYDLYYVRSRGLLLDFKIILKTISTVLKFKGQ